MSYCSITIHRYSGTQLPKSFSGNNKDAVVETFKDYAANHEQTYKDDCYIKVTRDDITVISHERDPMEALKDACKKLFTEEQEVKYSNMAVVTDDEVEEDDDDLDEEKLPDKDEEDIADELDDDTEVIDPDDVPDDRKIDGEVIDEEWDGLIEDDEE